MTRSRLEPTIDKVAEAIAAGQLWRAKEILSGRVRSRSFDPDLFEELGRVLLKMGDELEAGRFLLLSGKRRPEYQDAIGLFFQRYSRAGWQNMLASLPAAVRACSWSELPQQLRADLEAAGVPPRSDTDIWPSASSDSPKGKMGWAAILIVVLGLVAIGFVLAVLIVHFHYEV